MEVDQQARAISHPRLALQAGSAGSLVHTMAVAEPGPSSLPVYSPSSRTPPYSKNPRPDERRLAITTRSGVHAHTALTGSVRIRSRRTGIALELGLQEQGATVPCFGRGAIISGRVELDDPDSVLRVEVELEGHLKLTIAEGGKKSRSIFRVVHTIWNKDNVSAHTRTCQRFLNFLIPMPSGYDDGGKTRPLPPSYQVVFPGVPGLFADSLYSMTVRVTRRRRMLWKLTNSLSTPIKYYPRTRAPRTITKYSLPFFSLLKIAPEEFRQVQSTMKARVGSGFAPIHCLLFIPSSCVYAMTDEIPFHVQLIAPMTSLLAFTYPYTHTYVSRTSAIAELQSSFHPLHTDYNPNPAPSGASMVSASTISASIMHNLNSISQTLSFTRSNKDSRPSLRVFILRQIAVEVRGQRAWRTCVLGEGKLSPSPPGHEATQYSYPHPIVSRQISSAGNGSPRPSFMRHRESISASIPWAGPSEDPDPIESLDWDGVVRVKNPKKIQVGGFVAGNLLVKDFIVLSLVPPDPARNPLIEHQHAHPIRLVTDPLEEVW